MHFGGGVTTSGENAKEVGVNPPPRQPTGGLFVLTSFVFALSNTPCTLRRCQGKQTLQLSDRCSHYVDKDCTDANEPLPQMNGTDGGWINEEDQRQEDYIPPNTRFYASFLFLD